MGVVPMNRAQKVVDSAEITLDAQLNGNLGVRLWENDFAPSKDSVLADFVAATFGGYSEIISQPVGTAVQQADGSYDWGLSAVFSFHSTSNVGAPKAIRGFVVFESGQTPQFFWIKFPTPIPMTPSIVWFHLQLQMKMDSQGRLSILASWDWFPKL